MSLDDDINILSQTSFFEGINAEQLRLLAFGADAENLNAGEELFLQDAQSDCGYVVVSGLIDLTINNNGVDKILGSVEPGGLVGELALITDNNRATNAVARRDTKLLRIPRVLFMRMLDKYPETAYDLHHKILRSVRATILQLEKIQGEFESKYLEEE